MRAPPRLPSDLNGQSSGRVIHRHLPPSTPQLSSSKPHASRPSASPPSDSTAVPPSSADFQIADRAVSLPLHGTLLDKLGARNRGSHLPPSEVDAWEKEVVFKGLLGRFRRLSAPALTMLYGRLRTFWLVRALHFLLTLVVCELTFKVMFFVGLPLIFWNRFLDVLIYVTSLWSSYRTFAHLYAVAFDEAPTESDFLKDHSLIGRCLFWCYAYVLSVCFLSPHPHTSVRHFKRWLDRYPCDEPVRSNDQFWLTDRRNNLCHILCFSVLDKIDMSDMIYRVEQNWLYRIPRFRSVLRTRFRKPVWRVLPMMPAGMQAPFISSARLKRRHLLHPKADPQLASPATSEFCTATDLVKSVSVPLKSNRLVHLPQNVVVPLDVYEELNVIASQPFDDDLPRWRMICLSPVVADPDLLISDRRIFDFTYLVIIAHHGLMDGAALNWNVLTGITDPKPPSANGSPMSHSPNAPRSSPPSESEASDQPPLVDSQIMPRPATSASEKSVSQLSSAELATSDDGVKQIIAKTPRPTRLQYLGLCLIETFRFCAAAVKIVFMWGFWLPEGPALISGGPASPPTGRRIVAPPVVIEFQALKDAAAITEERTKVRVSPNDVLMAATIRTLAKLRGSATTSAIPTSVYSQKTAILVPMQCRLQAPTKTENVTSPGLLWAPLPEEQESLEQFTVRVHRAMQAVKARRYTYLTAAKVMVEVLPGFLAEWLMQRITHRTTVSVSNVMGTPDARTFRRKAVRSMQFWQPGHGHITMCVALLRVQDKALVQVAVDESELRCLRTVNCVTVKELISHEIRCNILAYL